LGKSPFIADKIHLHHKLMRLGLFHSESVISIYLLHSFFVFMAFILRSESDWFVLMLYLLLTGMMVPPNMGPHYSESFTRIFPEVASEKNVSLMPFLLKDVAGEPDLNLEDGIHPNKKGHKIVAENLWPYLKPLLEEADLE